MFLRHQLHECMIALSTWNSLVAVQLSKSPFILMPGGCRVIGFAISDLQRLCQPIARHHVTHHIGYMDAALPLLGV